MPQKGPESPWSQSFCDYDMLQLFEGGDGSEMSSLVPVSFFWKFYLTVQYFQTHFYLHLILGRLSHLGNPWLANNKNLPESRQLTKSAQIRSVGYDFWRGLIQRKLFNFCNGNISTWQAIQTLHWKISLPWVLSPFPLPPELVSWVSFSYCTHS